MTAQISLLLSSAVQKLASISRWHLLSHSEGGFTTRAAHSAVYIQETDSLYVFGGFDLNNVLGDLVVYQFKTSQWEDESGKHIGKLLIASEISQLKMNN